jgi:hypothetical protein
MIHAFASEANGPLGDAISAYLPRHSAQAPDPKTSGFGRKNRYLKAGFSRRLLVGRRRRSIHVARGHQH